MLEIGLFHNGASSLPVITDKNGITFNDGSLPEVHRAAQETLVNQVRQGILAEKLGFQSFWLTEHHFQPEGAEMSPNPLMVQMAVAAHTRRIRLGQAANIIVWHHPVRLAEQIALLDVISGGRVECGIGRGYQPRENETLGRPYGSTIQDQERNRKAFEESIAIMKKCWTEPSFSHHGEFFSVPPTYTKWNHKQTIAYFQRDGMGRRLDDVLALGDPDMYSAGNPVQATTTTLKELQVFPQPLQKPHPQLWMPLTSERSIRWASARGMNGGFIAEPIWRVKINLEQYYDEAEKNGWPDLHNRGRFKYGWDAEKKRWTGHDVPDFIADRPPSYRPPRGATGIASIAGDTPFIMQTDALGWLYAPSGPIFSIPMGSGPRPGIGSILARWAGGDRGGKAPP